MFMINRLNKWVFGDGSKEAVIEVPDGQLYLVRPLSPKGYSELIYKDASISVRRTSTDFNYQLVVTRVFEEGEEELLAEEEGGENSLQNQDEQSFLLDEALQFRVTIRDTGEKVFAWRDLDGSAADLWEFVCDFNTKPETVEAFQVAAFRAQFERRYKKPADEATVEELEVFSFLDEPIPPASPLQTATPRSPAVSPSPATTTRLYSAGEVAEQKMTPSKAKAPAPVPQVDTTGRDQLCKERGELHLYDLESRTFVMKDGLVELMVFDLGNFNYWLKAAGNNGSLVGRPVTDDLAPVFNFEYLSFIFNVFGEDGNAASWLLRVKDQPTLDRVQQGVMQALWEHQNRTKWSKNSEAEQQYLIETLNDLELTDVPEGEEEEEEEEEEDDDDSDAAKARSEHYDSDESDDDVEVRDKDGNVNSLLAVGAKHDRSFVVRGSKIGVFKHNDQNQLEFATNISKVQTPNGKLFSPKKVMLHMSDRNMILQDPTNSNAVYRMDLETGKVVDEWKVHDDIPINVFAPEEKFAQLTDKQTFLGLSNNAMYRVDPRLSGNKLVDTDMKSYATKGINFTTAATTDSGYIAIGNEKGDVRLFDTLGKMAKTALPALGGEIIGLDVSADGRYVLATCKTYLLLIDTLQKDGKFEGKLGFERAFPASKKPTPYKLTLTPPHIAEFQHSTGKPLSFTPARFNTGPDNKETTIITATGPFIITWSLKKIMDKRRDPYSIKRYAEDVKADNFRFGTDKGIIVALPNEVDMVKRAQLKKPTRESIAPPPPGRASAGGRRSGTRGSYLGRNDIVNSPY